MCFAMQKKNNGLRRKVNISHMSSIFFDKGNKDTMVDVISGEVCQNPCGTAMQGRHATKP